VASDTAVVVTLRAMGVSWDRLNDVRDVRRYEEVHSRLSAFSPRCDVTAVVHVFYPGLWPQVQERLARAERPLDVVVTTPLRDWRPPVDSRLTGWPEPVVLRVPNRGRDVLPFVRVCSGLRERGVDVVVKVHTKKSSHFDGGSSWFEQCLDGLMPDRATIEDLRRASQSPGFGVAGPAELFFPLSVYLRGIKEPLSRELERLHGPMTAQRVLASPDMFGFFAGTMFWTRLAHLDELFAKLRLASFEKESGQTDSTMAHVVERLFSLEAQLRHRQVLNSRTGQTLGSPVARAALPGWAAGGADGAHG
jgi:lipopolysaccharide biosynthesis protein